MQRYTRVVDQEESPAEINSANVEEGQEEWTEWQGAREREIALSVRADSHWSAIPTDVILLFCQYLDGRSLAQLQQCDRIAYKLTRRRELWMNLVANTHTDPHLAWTAPWIDDAVQDEIQAKIGLKRPPRTRVENPMRDLPEHFDPCIYYQERYTATLTVRRNIMEARSSAERSDLLERETHSQLSARWWEEVILPIVGLLLFLTFLVQLIRQLASGFYVNYWTFGPLLALVALLSVWLVATFYRRWRHSILFDRYLSDEDRILLLSVQSVFTRVETMSYFRHTRSHVCSLLECLESSDESAELYNHQRQAFWAHLTFVTVSLGVALWLVLIAFSCTNAIEASVTVVFIPLYLVNFLALCFLVARSEISRGSWLQWCEFVIDVWVLLSFTIQLIRCNRYLMEPTMSAQLFLITLLDGYHLIAFVYILVQWCREKNDQSNQLELSYWSKMLLVWAMVGPPTLIFQLLLGFIMDHMREFSWVIVFTPLSIPVIFGAWVLLDSSFESHNLIVNENRTHICEIKVNYPMPCV